MSMDASLEQEEWVCVSCGAEVVTDASECPRCGSASDPLLGRVLAGKYKLIKKLAGGGMGHVYLAEHTRLRYKKERAIKILRAELLHDNTLRKRFLREVELTHLVSQDNPHIVHIHDDYGFEDGVGFYVMEFLEGDTLEDRIQAAPQGHPARWVRDIVLQICDAMQSIHESDIIHRDLKPANIFLVKDKDGQDFVKVMDFGIAKAEHAGTQHTKEGAIIGTAQYLAPEQIRRLPGVQLDGRCDIYALGCIMFELLSGRAPFTMESSTAALDGVAGMSMAFQTLVMKHLTEPAPTLRSVNPQLPPGLSLLVGQMLAKLPEDRPADMASIATQLRAMELPEAPSSADLPSDDLPSGQFPHADTIPSQDLPSEVLRNSSAHHTHTPAPSQGGAYGDVSYDGLDAAQPSSKRGLIFAAVVFGLLAIGAVAALYLADPGDTTDPSSTTAAAAAAKGTTPPQDAAPSRPAAMLDAGPAKAPAADAGSADATPSQPRRATPPKATPRPRSRPRMRPRSRPRQRRRRAPRRRRRIALKVSSRYLRTFKIAISPRKAARLRGRALYPTSRGFKITITSRANPFGYYACSFSVPKRARMLQLNPLSSKSGLAPDSARYCLARWK